METRRTIATLGVLALGIVLGWGGARLFSPSSQPTSGNAADRAPSTTGGEVELDGSAARPAEPVPSPSPTPPELGEPPSAAEAAFLAEALRRERERRELAIIRDEDDAPTILERVLDHGADPGPLVESFDAFRRPLRTSQAAPQRVMEPGKVSFARDAPIPEVLEFGPGRFVIEGGLALREAVETLEIRGAGIDRTEIVLGRNELVSTQADLASLWVHDLSIAGGGPAITIHGKSRAMVLVEDVSFRGWASGGFSSAIAVGGRAYLGVRRTDFLGSPGEVDNALSVRGQAVALFEECSFLDAGTAILASGTVGEGNSLRLRRCVFENTKLAHSGIIAQYGPVEGTPALFLDVEDCDVSYGSDALEEAARLEEWGAGYARSVAGLRIAPGIPRPTAGDLIDILRRLEGATPAERITRLAYAGPARGGGLYFDMTRVTGSARRIIVEGSEWRATDETPDRRHSGPREKDMATLISLADLLATGGPSLGDAVHWVHYESGLKPDAEAGVARRRLWRWDATTGALRSP